MKTTKLLLAALLCLLSVGGASAQNSCFTPHFTRYTSQVAALSGVASNPNAPGYAGDPSTATGIKYSQTVTVSGYTTIGSACQMPVSVVQHWIQSTNIMYNGATKYGGVGGVATGAIGVNASNKSCASCTFNLSTTATSPILSLELPVDIGTADGEDAICSLSGNFFHSGGSGGSGPSQFLRLMFSRSIRDTSKAEHNCTTVIDPKTGNSRQNCIFPITSYCTNYDVAIDPIDIWDMKFAVPPQYQWWELADLCVRFGSTNTVPWVCPTFHFPLIPLIPVNNLPTPPYGFGFRFPPPPKAKCADLYDQ